MGYIRLERIRGDVSISMSDIAQFGLARNGAPLNANYIVRVGRGSQALLICQNDTEHPIQNGTFKISKYCRRTSPRPGGPPPLQGPDKTVLADTRNANDTDRLRAENSFSRLTLTTAANLGLSPDDSERLTHQLDQIRAQLLDPVQEVIEIAKVYIEYGYRESSDRSETFNRLALKTLKTGIDTSLENSQAHLLQADIFLMIDLPSSAREQYTKAFEIADRNEILVDKARSYIGLALATEELSENGDVIRYLEKARVIYENLNKLEESAILTALISNI